MFVLEVGAQEALERQECPHSSEGWFGRNIVLVTLCSVTDQKHESDRQLEYVGL